MEVSYKNEDLKITYSITVCSELIEIQRLVGFLDKHKRPQDDIVILFDSKNGSLEVRDYLKYHSHLLNFSWYEGEFNRNFAEWKNKLIGLCEGDFIFNIDADEIPNETLIKYLSDFIELNPSVDAYWVPRINTLEGDEYEIDQYVTVVGWKKDPNGWINFPDPQLRLFRNDPEIRWEGEVHEVIKGYKTISRFPFEEQFSLYHPKTLKKQIKQNNLYSTL